MWRRRSVCIHNKIRSYCKLCKGGGICVHLKFRASCKICGINSRYVNTIDFVQDAKFAKEDQFVNIYASISVCRKCNGGAFREHKKLRSLCIQCGGGGLCNHDKKKNRCNICRQLMPLEEALRRYKYACFVCGVQLNRAINRAERLCNIIYQIISSDQNITGKI